MYLLILFFPLLGSVLTGLFGRFFGYRGGALITTSCVIFSALLSGIAFYEVALSGSVCHFRVAPWFFSEMFDCWWGFYFDTLTVVMLIVVTFVSSLVHFYSISYMSEDAHIPRFMCYLSLFTFFMLILVTADNFIQMFLGWEGVGVASYLLINFWYTRVQASKASIKAMLVNRVGDFGLALGIMALFSLFKTVDFIDIFACAAHLSETTFFFCNHQWHALTVISILLFIGAVGKSAQLGLHTWLPDAMEGPTPVSALIHAATMVTAGIFLLARCSPIFEHAPSALIFITCIGGMTCFFAATTGIMQNDIKRVIAYSTCSQLGYMVFACGISSYSVGIFHLMNHAFFKALLFLSAGSVIHALSDEQDMRKMGGVVKLLPFTYGMMLIGSLSLVGFPFLTGFYSKDLILEVACANYKISGTFAYWLGSICVAFTSYYSFRLLFLTFLNPSSSFKTALQNCHDAPLIMALPLILLAFGSIFIGYFARDMMVGLGTCFWGNSIFVLPNHSLLLESEYIPQFQKFIPLFFTFLGGGIAFFIMCIQYNSIFNKENQFLETKIHQNENNFVFPSPIQNTSNLRPFLSFPQVEKKGYTKIPFFVRKGFDLQKTWLGYKIYTMLNKRWLFDKIYNDFIAQKSLNFGYHISFKTLDKGFFEIIGPFGISRLFKQLTRYLARLQSGMIYHYAGVMLIGLIFLITVVGIWDFLQIFIDNRLYFIFLVTFLFYSLMEPADSKY
jgi:NADH-ubiquinone oxidoreductase chain 5